MSTLFISDLHLDAARPAIVELFERFLAGEAQEAEALYILGDLFESWIGDDDDSELATRAARALRGLADHGVPVHFMAGNRDFLLGADYAARCGMTLLEDGTVVDLHGTPTLLMHGDTLCTDDAAYQRFRTQVRDPAWQRDFLARPLAERRAFAAQARAASQAHTGGASEAIMDVNATAVAAALRQAGVHHLVHGHTHRPAVHALDLDGQPAERIVLGDWYDQGSVLRVSLGRRQLSRL
ncbi:MAG TPA: UDP-2,3-diacylglucosamine diphosphatase [Rhodanobacteraceae bacterium]|nr:UDP-2,3-diacylglucosamine diphosphatase [Rhodanobacteraceae bacterium]